MSPSNLFFLTFIMASSLLGEKCDLHIDTSQVEKEGVYSTAFYLYANPRKAYGHIGLDEKAIESLPVLLKYTCESGPCTWPKAQRTSTSTPRHPSCTMR